MIDILFKIWQIIKAFLPDSLTKVGSVVKDTVVKKNTLLEQLKRHYEQHGWQWQPVTFGVLRDTRAPKKHQVFNDILWISHGNEFFCFWCTSEPGKHWNTAARKKYLGSAAGWPGRYNLGHIKDFFYISSYHNMPAMRPAFRVPVTDMDTGKQRNAGDMLIHARESTGEHVYFASAGCVVFKHKDNAYIFDKVVKSSEAYQANRKAKFDFSVSDVNNFNILGQKIH